MHLILDQIHNIFKKITVQDHTKISINLLIELFRKHVN